MPMTPTTAQSAVLRHILAAHASGVRSLTGADLSRAFPGGNVHGHVRGLLARGLLARDGLSYAATPAGRAWTRRALTMLQPGYGERRACVREVECLDEFLAVSNRRESSPAHCPAGCEAYREPNRKAELNEWAGRRFG